jgi:hypothetical protein
MTLVASWTHVERVLASGGPTWDCLYSHQFVVTVDGRRMQFSDADVADGTACDWATRQTFSRMI